MITTCHIHNRIPSKKTKTSPYEIWKGRKPSLNYLKLWGYLAYYRVPNPIRTKLRPRALKSMFIEYAKNSKSYRLLDLESNVIIQSRDIKFLDTSFLGDFSKSLSSRDNTNFLQHTKESPNVLSQRK